MALFKPSPMDQLMGRLFLAIDYVASRWVQRSNLPLIGGLLLSFLQLPSIFVHPGFIGILAVRLRDD